MTEANGCQLDAAIADLDGLGLDKARRDFLAHLIKSAHDDGYWEGVDSMMPLVGGRCDDCGNGDDRHDSGGSDPDSPSPAKPGLPGGDSGLGGGCVDNDSDNAPRYGFSFINREDITPVGPDEYIRPIRDILAKETA